MQTDSMIRVQNLECSDGKLWRRIGIDAPNQLNALNLNIIDALQDALIEAEDDENIIGVWLEGMGDKGFCAGGDVRSLYTSLKDKSSTPADVTAGLKQFFRAEYSLDAYIYEFPKPIVVWADGIVMGGGVGLMMGASHRVVTERSTLAMPEISIGLFPDCGATWFLNRVDPKLSRFLGMTGCRLKASDALIAKWADHIIFSDQKDAVLAEILKTKWVIDPDGDTSEQEDQLTALLNRHNAMKATRGVASALPSEINQCADWIGEVFSAPSLEELFARLEGSKTNSNFADEAKNNLLKGCPTSAIIAFEQVRRFRKITLRQAFKMENELAVWMASRPDFAEGIRSTLIDRDRHPKWNPASINSKLKADVASYLQTISPF
jgi:enoyl-CoA hydratase/carnithine racemase